MVSTHHTPTSGLQAILHPRKLSQYERHDRVEDLAVAASSNGDVREERLVRGLQLQERHSSDIDSIDEQRMRGEDFGGPAAVHVNRIHMRSSTVCATKQ